ncbi:septal ring lytic transglycosylase RlpA family protein [Zoogloea sp.]|uniref:septal ring lytic transglycosylase RlpA family protein n=1 Tax=Zoogloea sp. TaxID=49181 RepID=UPI0035B4A401
MPPVAMFRRACLALAPLGSAFLLTGCAGLPQQDPASEASVVGALHAQAVQAGLRPAQASSLNGGRLRYAVPEDASAQPEEGGALVAPVYEGGDYALARGAVLGGNPGAFREKGMASWYGKALQGRRTSSGDPYDMYALTGAHPSLPIPSYVRVTNLANGRSAIVRINDRGPVHPGRIIDLSYAAAYKLGFADQGHANVELSLVLPEGVAMVQPRRPVPPLARRKAAVPTLAHASRPSTPVPAPAPQPSVVAPAAPVAPRALAEVAVASATASAGQVAQAPAHAVAPRPEREGVFLQLGAFASSVNAENFKGFVEHELKWMKESVSVLASEGKYRLQLGPFASALEAREIADRIATTLKLKPVVKGRAD